MICSAVCCAVAGCSVISLDDTSHRQDRLCRPIKFMEQQHSENRKWIEWSQKGSSVACLETYQLLTSEDGRSEGPAKTSKEERTESRNNVMVTTKVRQC